MMQGNLKQLLEQHVQQRVAAIMEAMQARVEKNVRRELIQELIGNVVLVEPASVTVPTTLTPKDIQGVLDAAVDPVAMFAGVQRIGDNWICIHCARSFTSRRGASIHARTCSRCKVLSTVQVSEPDDTKSPRPCIVPDCNRPSKGPRYHFLCDEHRTAKKRDVTAWQRLHREKAQAQP